MLKLNGFDHINMNVKNLDESVAFYQKVFGMEVKEEGVYNGANWAIIGISQKVYLCLYQRDPVHPEDSSGINHLGFHIDNFDEALEKLEKENIEISTKFDYGKSRSIYIIDPSGYEFELSEVFGGGLN